MFDRKEYNKIYRELHKKEMKIYQKEYRKNNASKMKDRKEYYKKYRKEYYKKNKEKVNTYMKNRYKNDINFKIKSNLRGRIWAVLVNNVKSTRTMELTGCTIDESKQWLENQFTEGMSWDNYGINGWEIDHVYPCSKFNLEQPYEQKIAFNWFNMQPLWKHDNRTKYNNIII